MAVLSSDYRPPESGEELLRRYADGERRFPDAELCEADLSGVTLDGATFDGSWFSDADFEGASLRGASFRLCNVKCANFRRADLTGASFQLSSVEAAEFEGALLAEVSFEGAGHYGYTVRGGDGFPNGRQEGQPKGVTDRGRMEGQEFAPREGLDVRPSIG